MQDGGLAREFLKDFKACGEGADGLGGLGCLMEEVLWKKCLCEADKRPARPALRRRCPRLRASIPPPCHERCYWGGAVSAFSRAWYSAVKHATALAPSCGQAVLRFASHARWASRIGFFAASLSVLPVSWR